MTYTDVMVDLETTGTMPDRSGIIQISAVKFNLETEAVDSDMFDRCLYIPPHRFWQEDTRSWWAQQNRAVLQQIMSRTETPQLVITDLAKWVLKDGNQPRFWSKPTHFDFSFLQSYCNDYEVPMPFSFREANDMNTWLRALYFPEPVPDLGLEFTGNAHNALFDVLNQIKLLFAHKKDAANGC